MLIEPELRLVLCETCQSEGRIYRGDYGRALNHSDPCPYCDGTGGEIIEVEPVDMEDLECPPFFPIA